MSPAAELAQGFREEAEEIEFLAHDVETKWAGYCGGCDTCGAREESNRCIACGQDEPDMDEACTGGAL
ncbi:MAG: hypothetical protein ACOH10_12590 [Rhodoglobus sp.]